MHISRHIQVWYILKAQNVIPLLLPGVGNTEVILLYGSIYVKYESVTGLSSAITRWAS